MMKIYRSQKSPQFALSVGKWKTLYGMDYFFQWTYASGINMMTQEVQLGDTKAALGGTDDNIVVFQTFKKCSQVSEVLLQR